MIFVISVRSAAALVFYLPFSGPSMKYGVHTEEKPESGIYFKIFEKNTISNKHPVGSSLQERSSRNYGIISYNKLKH